MVIAITLVKSIPDRESTLYHALKEVNGIMNLYHVFGEHDFVLIQEADNMEKLGAVLRQVEEQGDVCTAKTILVSSASTLEKMPTHKLKQACQNF